MTTTDIQTIPTDCNDVETEQDQKLDFSEMWKLRFKHNYSLGQIAAKMNCHKSTVMRRLDNHIKLLPNAAEIESFVENRLTWYNALAMMTTREMMQPDKLKAASYNNLAYGLSQVETQRRLEQGLATERIDSISVTASLSELDKRKSDLLRTITIQHVVPDTTSTKS